MINGTQKMFPAIPANYFPSDSLPPALTLFNKTTLITGVLPANWQDAYLSRPTSLLFPPPFLIYTFAFCAQKIKPTSLWLKTG